MASGGEKQHQNLEEYYASETHYIFFENEILSFLKTGYQVESFYGLISVIKVYSLFFFWF